MNGGSPGCSSVSAAMGRVMSISIRISSGARPACNLARLRLVITYDSGMVFVFYNKLLLRAFVFLTGALSAVCAWHYIALSAQKLGAGGVRDALAIISFLVAGWLVMLIAEVVDNHY